MTILTTEILCSESTVFSAAEFRHPEPLLYGVSEGGDHKLLLLAAIDG